jgi:2-iminobutanoate/2-iminopropanoate deaminase
MPVQAKTFGFGVPWESQFGYSQAMQVGETLYISGQLSHDDSGNMIGVGDFELQMKTSLANLDRILEHFGATRNQVVETTVLFRNLREDFDTAARHHREYFGEHRPTCTVMEVPDLAIPEQLLEFGALVRLDLEA